MRRDKQLLGWSHRGAVIYAPLPAAATPGEREPFTSRSPGRYLAAFARAVSDHRRLRYSQLLRQIAGLAVRNPTLVPLLLGVAWRFRARDWYRRPPFLPLPPPDYVQWRLHTAYGADGAPQAAEITRYLRWTARMKKQQRP